MPRTPTPIAPPRFVMLASVCVIVAALFFAQDVLIPLALALLLCFLLSPLVNRLERLGTGRLPAVLIVVLIACGLIGALGYVVTDQVFDLASNVDQYKDNVSNKLKALRPEGGVFTRFFRAAKEIQQKVEEPTTQAADAATQPSSSTAPSGSDEGVSRVADVIAGEISNRPIEPAASRGADALRAAATNPTTALASEEPVRVQVIPPEPSPMQLLAQYLGFALGPLGTAGIVVVFVFFMLLQREDMRNRLLRLVGQGQMTVTTQAIDDASGRISKYLLAQAIVNGTYGIAIAIGLWLIGLIFGNGVSFPSVILWGLLCAVLRFIPYIGPWIAAVFPMVVAFAVFPGFGVFAATVTLFVVIELLSNNFMEPMLYGSSTGMSTVAVLVSAVFWTWLWGPIGLLLATPLTVVLVVMGKHIPQLKFLDVLLGDEQALKPHERLYQRLLALDAEEAADLVREHKQSSSLEDVYETVLLPAVALVEQDRHRGQLDEERQTFIRQALRDIVEEMADEERATLIRADAAAVVDAAREAAAVASKPATSDPKRPPRVTLPKDCVINIVLLPSHDEADEIVNLMLTQLLELRGYRTFSIGVAKLASEMIAEIDQHHADVVVVSALPPAAVTHARYLCKRIHGKFPDQSMLVGVWTYKGDIKKAKDRIACEGAVRMAVSLTEALHELQQLIQPKLTTARDA